MAILQSPGVSITVVDESFYTPAAPGTVPLIVIATESNKQNAEIFKNNARNKGKR
jgi:hypothetical protein